MSQVLTEYFVSGFIVVLPTVSEDLNIPPATQTWPANAFSLVVACFLLPRTPHVLHQSASHRKTRYGPKVVGVLAWIRRWSAIQRSPYYFRSHYWRSVVGFLRSLH